ncbi:c-type cytochrome biogenesis protein CcmI [Govanella unica]|uniref:C-type cytochrome biogenesis protein CcmI n=1 Tax=Govanella unica TaxID=2975056 RepID=A0A9X3TW01_9PROT|nr:c-type cytochrome biogenesis protein CcmI [Govania unica]MDA5192716.1 c-type cytochrome biogenesis protein CcmI [Govania unica]
MSSAMMWGVFALMALLALGLATLPLWRRPRAVAEADRLTVYGRQLAELEMETKRGLLTPEAAQAARLEIERRILRLNETAVVPNAGGKGLLAGAAVTAVAGAFGLYLWLGHPELPDHPAEVAGAMELKGTAAGEPTLNALLDRLIAYLDTNPDAMEGWEHLRRAALSVGRGADYAAALERGVRTRPENVDLRVLYAESLIFMGQGQVSPAARLALTQADALDPSHPALRYYTGLALLQDNRPAEAEALWQKLLDEAPEGAEWRGQIAEKIAEAQAAQGKSSAASAIAALPADQQTQQIRGMVEGLAAKLEAAPDDAGGWLRLGRAWRVLGEPAKAQVALARGRAIAEKAGDKALMADFAAEAENLAKP